MISSKQYRVVFHAQGKVYELYARKVSTSPLLGFVEVAGIEFGPDREVVIDPTQERLREEFGDVNALHLPMHAVSRVEEVDRRRALKIVDGQSGEKIVPLPLPLPQR